MMNSMIMRPSVSVSLNWNKEKNFILLCKLKRNKLKEIDFHETFARQNSLLPQNQKRALTLQTRLLIFPWLMSGIIITKQTNKKKIVALKNKQRSIFPSGFSIIVRQRGKLFNL